MTVHLVLAAALAAAGIEPQAIPAAEGAVAAPPAAEAVAVPAAEVPPPAPAPAPKLVLPKGTMIRLMVTKEVNSRDNHPGDRFVLRVDEDVKVGGVTVIPIGAKGWGEVLDSTKSGGVGKSGKMSARLLYVEANGQRIELDGQRHSSGGPGAGNVVAGVVAFGPFGLFMKGGNASLKAGEILNGYTLSDAAFDAAPKSVP
ncbi:MAG TPA: hypothetical protein VF079_00545 [Sphingomicrobium sp.]